MLQRILAVLAFALTLVTQGCALIGEETADWTSADWDYFLDYGTHLCEMEYHQCKMDALSDTPDPETYCEDFRGNCHELIQEDYESHLVLGSINPE